MSGSQPSPPTLSARPTRDRHGMTTQPTRRAPPAPERTNQLVIDYLNKKGYTRAEAVLRAESSNQAIPADAEPRPKDTGPPKYLEAYARLDQWTRDALELYKPEVQKLLWPFFVYFFLNLVDQFYTKEARAFWNKYQEQFKSVHEHDLRRLEHTLLPEHQEDSSIARIYKQNRYRLPITHASFQYLMQFLESLQTSWYKLFIQVIEKHMDIRQMARAADDKFSFEAILRRDQEDQVVEDEGIPGHKAGSAIISTDPKEGNSLANLKLGKLPMEPELEEDLRGDLKELDLQDPAAEPSLLDIHGKVNIKQEDEDEGPNRTEIPYPISTARDVAMEVQKIRENRDRLKLEGRTGGVGPGLSCVMYTFHNTKDHITCLEFSGDNSLVAAGTDMSYIRIWSMEGTQIGVDGTGKPVNSKRLIGHAGPVYGLSFAPSTVQPPHQQAETRPQWLLSSSADGTIRLWNLTMWQCMVVYRGHVGPVWDVKFSPLGTYFVSSGMDKTARLWITSKVSPRRFFVGHDEDVDVVAWHPNTAYVFTASCDKTVRMWSVASGQAVRMFTGHTSPITALACSRNGKLLASADEGGNILLWDLGPGKLLKQLRGHSKGGIWSLSWSVESTVLVSGGADQTVRVWDVNLPAKEGSVAKPGDGAKPDGTTTSNAVTVSTANTKKKGKGPSVSADQISAFLTKKTPVKYVGMTNMNLIIAGGSFLPENYVS
ncbi:Transcription initiation factor TFIID subunit 5 [Lithohypha guttulata]|uniref:Transcription initiation factor TFIID subunit 5 n=1 Tax=Lithohypha guttulata TaxID=1690604 RepID=A0AAN7SXR4_9EURO|nr:Transcription initiation factor TFIID subunit 5 [Lithohypha guttulata]KAK5106098.1 Transcription initiation factor TFIID subunit 5 [Lithohypha guttulata]